MIGGSVPPSPLKLTSGCVNILLDAYFTGKQAASEPPLHTRFIIVSSSRLSRAC